MEPSVPRTRRRSLDRRGPVPRTLRAPRAPRGRPPVDERLVMPETRYEIIDGEVEHVPPSDEPHGTRHAQLATLLVAHAAAGYLVACDMLTRTSERSDMAPDASVFPAARDGRTGGRRIEELAFEVVSTERLGHAAKKARALAERGVRRVFAIDVERRRALAWSARTDAWEILPPDGAIEDRALAVPLPLRPLVEAATADDAVARALIAKRNPVIVEAIEGAKQEGRQEGERLGEARGLVEGKVAALLAVLRVRGLRVSKKAEKRIRAADAAVLDAWIRQAVRCASVKDLLGNE